MRSSIAVFLLLMRVNLMGMEQPSQKMQISPQELKQEFERQGSYLSLLPKEGLPDLLRKYAFNSLDEIITAIRAAYLNDSVYKEQFLHDRPFNQAIINKLAQHFKDTEPSPMLLKMKIALLLNTPASFTTLSTTNLNITDLKSGDVFSIFKEYLDHISRDYQQALKYMQQFSSNISHLGYFQEQSLINLAVILYFFEKFDPQITDEVPSADMKIINRLITMSGGYLADLEQIRTQTDLRNLNLLQETILIRRMEPIIMTALCNYLAIYLMQIIKRENNEYIAYVINHIFSRSYRNTNFEKCFIKKLTGELGKQIVQYIGANASQSTYFFEPNNMIVSLWDYALNHENNATIIKLLSGFRLKYDNTETLYNSDHIILKIKLRTQFLFDIVQSSRTDVTVLREFINRFSANYNAADGEGVTVLMHAIQNAHFDKANFLLDQANITLNACDNNGHNALSFAELLPQSQEREALIKRLKEMGATEEGSCAIQ